MCVYKNITTLVVIDMGKFGSDIFCDAPLSMRTGSVYGSDKFLDTHFFDKFVSSRFIRFVHFSAFPPGDECAICFSGAKKLPVIRPKTFDTCSAPLPAICIRRRSEYSLGRHDGSSLSAFPDVGKSVSKKSRVRLHTVGCGGDE